MRTACRRAILRAVWELSILSDRFFQAAAESVRRARQAALNSGHAVVFVDRMGRYVEERPDGRRFEIRLDPSSPRESHRVVLRELGTNAA